MQFSNKKKYVKLLTKEIAHRKQAILDLRQSLVIIRDKLAELGVVVTLDDLTLDKLEALPEKIPSKLLELCGHLLTRQQYMAERLQECSQLDQRIKDDVQVFKEEGVELHKTYDLMVKMNKQWEEPEESNENESAQEVEELVEEMVEELVEVLCKCCLYFWLTIVTFRNRLRFLTRRWHAPLWLASKINLWKKSQKYKDS